MTSFSNRPRRLVSLFAVALVAVVAVAALPMQEREKPAGPSLHDLMEEVRDGLKTVASALGSENSEDEALDGVRRMEVALLASKDHRPDNLSEIPEERRAAHVAAFKADMARSLQLALDVEIAILEGKNDEAMSILRGQLLDSRDNSHEKYQSESDRSERPQRRGGRRR